MYNLKRLILAASLLAPMALHATESVKDDKVDPNLPARLPLNELRVFAEAFDRVSSAYVEEIDDRTLLENAIRGMLNELDPHSAYLLPQAYNDLQVNTTGEFGGLGIEVTMENGLIKIENAARQVNPSVSCFEFSISAGLAKGNSEVELDSVMEFAEDNREPIAQFQCNF